MNKVNLLRIALFGSWLFTLGVIVTLVFVKMGYSSAEWEHLQPGLTGVFGMIMPQLSMMMAFFFSTDRKRQVELAEHFPQLATVAIMCSIFYHIVFLASIIFGVMFEAFTDNDLDANFNAIAVLMGWLSIIGIAPVAFLFARERSETEAGDSPRNGSQYQASKTQN